MSLGTPEISAIQKLSVIIIIMAIISRRPWRGGHAFRNAVPKVMGLNLISLVGAFSPVDT